MRSVLTEPQVKEMYRYMAIADYEDRYVIPTSHEELRHEILMPSRATMVLPSATRVAVLVLGQRYFRSRARRDLR